MKRHSAFTLVELMVAVAIGVMLIGLLAHVTSGVSGGWLRARQTLDNFSTARALINALDRDLRSAVIRQDLAAFPSGGNDLAFYARQFGQTDVGDSMRALTFVSLRLEHRNGQTMLVREDVPFDFGASSPVWIGSATGNPLPASADAVTRTMPGGVYCFVHRFIQADGSEETTFRDATSATPSRAIRISLAILDERADALLQESDHQAELRTLLTEAADVSPVGAAGAWEALITTGQLDHLPKSVTEGIRFYERVVPLTPSGLSATALSLH